MLYDPRWRRPTDIPGQILWDAADYIESHGWLQGSFRNSLGAACLLGAVAMVSIHRSVQDRGEAKERLYKAIPHPNPMQWNDQKDRTKQEVIEALRSAARMRPTKWMVQGNMADGVR